MIKKPNNAVNSNKTIKLRPLQWKIVNDTEETSMIARSTPLRYIYHINQSYYGYSLVLLDANYNFEKRFKNPFHTIAQAKKIARNHYLKLIQQIIIKS